MRRNVADHFYQSIATHMAGSLCAATPGINRAKWRRVVAFSEFEPALLNVFAAIY
jgi:hypothetical protein